MLPSQRERESAALGDLKHMRQPLRTSSKFKKLKRGNPNPLSAKSAVGSKKKRPGPRLRNALKAAALAEQAGSTEQGILLMPNLLCNQLAGRQGITRAGYPVSI